MGQDAKRKIIELEKNRKYQTADGLHLIVKETGEIKGKPVKNVWSVRAHTGHLVGYHQTWDEMLRLNNMEL